jgi:hypothetical protein
MRKINSTKGQMTLGDAPTVVLMVGFVFLVMATIALVSDKFGTALLSESTASVTNESATIVGGVYTLATDGELGFASWNATRIINGSAITALTNETLVEGVDYQIFSANGSIGNLTTWDAGKARITYSYVYTPTTVAYNTTGDLNTEIANNTSIAGIILTISLIGIVLTILIGVFVGVRRGSRV